MMQARPQSSSRRSLVFTSAGDRANLLRWLEGPREFDLYVAYYGDQLGRYADICEHYLARKDSKFGNLNHIYRTQPELLNGYEAILVMDDDIIISAKEINRLFQLRDEQDFWLLQPSFNPVGKVSWPITQAHWQCRWRYTNFVEMTAPLFRKDKLDDFMREFDPVLTGTGTDYWFMQCLGDKANGKVAVIDEITCINPNDRSKGGQRECDRLQNETQRSAAWQYVQKEYGILPREQREFGRQLKSVPVRWISPFFHWPIDAYAFLRKRLGRLYRSW